MRDSVRSILNWLLLLSSTALVCLFLGIILYDIFSKGLPALSWEFVSSYPTQGMTKGGILPTIVGTVMLTFITTLFAVPFGITCAVYLNEYAKPSLLTNIIRASIRNLAGIPSIIYGLFGLALFVQGLGLGTSVLSAGLTLGLLSLPYIITTTEEALKTIPNSMREATLALGVTQFETIRDVVLPQALSGILTGVILTLSRAAGETAPILFTGVAFYINGISFALNQEFMSLPYHLYMLSTQHSAIEQVRPLAYATAVVLIVLVFLLNAVAFIIRFKHRNKN
ncbi:phosphate transport system permease protein [Flexibacter flexilis DSM 6793]|uniref:Phosphate transport system permease protein PstA n=1 Tax=Flexibacter flexilis DSM 6793 TaxID=927664 RepID=A0A1I1J6S8_9BACT|nr:phosphate ABC transporter permease PstA [Flexibacter flexilis]SFC44244.1 phosphate transport system permease protein [Flexibacter flexilis DSM 6793]